MVDLDQDVGVVGPGQCVVPSFGVAENLQPAQGLLAAGVIGEDHCARLLPGTALASASGHGMVQGGELGSAAPDGFEVRVLEVLVEGAEVFFGLGEQLRPVVEEGGKAFQASASRWCWRMS
ncbi:hypothetical protein [Streptomyces sp. RTd22]|uniref:hypothetical protein n=1 Tax=Streptomyces sp. RTd22 TaxID=1841249 RepID=UPI0007C53586|nr:hypothetical protein [Streptomyces sp. RTd22]